MKPLLFALTLLGMVALHAQETVSGDEWKRENNESWRLAFLLFPSFATSGSPLSKEYLACLPSPKIYPRLYSDSFLPLFTVIQAAQYLQIQPDWSALKDSEKLETVQQVAYVSSLLIRVIREQNGMIASYQSGGSNITPQGFIPDDLQNVGAREAFSDHSDSSSSDSQPTQGNGVPPEPVPTPPLTTTAVDPQSGNVTVTVH